MATEPVKKDDYIDIDALIDKVSKLPIPDTEKANLLRKFKENMMNPAKGEIENLNRIQSKYASLYPMASASSMPGMQPGIGAGVGPEFLPSINPNLGTGLGSMMMQQMPQQQVMTTAHFEVLRNKMDSIQLELVDLLRHVKDYTQRYMNATRQQDMEKIDAYINGLFEVDKQLKRAEDQAAMMSAEEDAEAAAAGPEKSTITRATDGIKNFLGSIGDGVSGITSFVSNTANIVNDTLSKKVLGGTTPASPGEAPSTPAPNTTPSNRNRNTKGNIVSVDEYIQSNMNQVEGTPTPSSSSSKSNIASNITSSNNINAMAANKPTPKPKAEQPTGETAEGNQEDITAAINKLNDTMNADIANTVAQGPSSVSVAGEPQAGGSRKEDHLTRKIRMLRLRLTKRKLEAELHNDKDKTIRRNKPSSKTHGKKTMKNRK